MILIIITNIVVLIYVLICLFNCIILSWSCDMCIDTDDQSVMIIVVLFIIIDMIGYWHHYRVPKRDPKCERAERCPALEHDIYIYIYIYIYVHTYIHVYMYAIISSYDV